MQLATIATLIKETGSDSSLIIWIFYSQGLSHREMELVKSVASSMSSSSEAPSDQQLKLMTEVSKELPASMPKEEKVEIVAAAAGTADPDVTDAEIEVIADVMAKVGDDITPVEAQVLVEMAEEAAEDSEQPLLKGQQQISCHYCTRAVGGSKSSAVPPAQVHQYFGIWPKTPIHYTPFL